MVNLTTKVGVSIGEPERPQHVAVVREPATGAMLRTKGRLYVLIDVEEGVPDARDVAAAAAEVLRDEYYYDLSAGIEVSLRRAVLDANKRARVKLRAGADLDLACAVLCRNEMYVATVGAGEVFVVRRARLFVPGTRPGELLTDYAYRVQRAAPPLGAENEMLIAIWREQAEPGDTLVLSVARLADVIGPDELKGAVLMLHPSAAAQQLRDRYRASAVAERAAPGVLVVEVAPRTAALRVRPQPAPAVEHPQRIAEQIRRLGEAGTATRRGVERATGNLTRAIGRRVVAVLAITVSLLAHRRTPLPRSAEVAAVRALRRRRVTIALALALLFAASGVGVLAYVDYQDVRASGNVSLTLLRARQELDAARAAAAKQPPDVSVARERLERAERFVGEAASAKRVDVRQVADLRARIAELREKLTTIVLDLAKLDAKSAPASLDYALKDVLYVADPGAAKLWRVPSQAPQGAAVLAKGGDAEGISIPTLVSTAGDVVYVMDEARRFFRYEGSTRREILIRDRKFTDPIDFAVFSSNLYVLDRASGQVWKYEPSSDGQYGSPAIAYLERALAPGTARSLAVDGDIWIVNAGGQLLRFKRGSGATAGQLEFAIRWRGEPAHADAIQAKEGQGRKLWLLDSAARRVIQLAKDGAEEARIALPAELPEPSGFVVIEELGQVVTLHGTRLARTDLAR